MVNAFEWFEDSALIKNLWIMERYRKLYVNELFMTTSSLNERVLLDHADVVSVALRLLQTSRFASEPRLWNRVCLGV